MKMVLDQNGSQPSNIKNYYFTWDPPLFDELFLILKDILIAYVSEIFFFHSPLGGILIAQKISTKTKFIFL